MSNTKDDLPIKNKLFTAEEIRIKLLQMNPQIEKGSKFTNPYIYDDVKKWYHELGGIPNNIDHQK